MKIEVYSDFNLVVDDFRTKVVIDPDISWGNSASNISYGSGTVDDALDEIYNSIDVLGNPEESKTTPIDADNLTLWDSVVGKFKKLTWANLKVALNEVYLSIVGYDDLEDELKDSIDLANSALQSETDPIFVASQAHNIDATDITNLGNLSGTNTGDQDLSGYVPYTGATSDVDLGSHKITLGADLVVANKGEHKVFLYEGTSPIFRHQTSYWNGSSFVSTNGYGFGKYSLQNNTGSYSNGFGSYSLQNNTGSFSNGFGSYSLQNNTGSFSNGFGGYSLRYNIGSYSNGFGYGSLQNNTGVNSNGFGSYSLRYNTGVNSNGFGYYSLQYNTGSYSNGFGSYSLRYNQNNWNTALGYSSFSSFYDNVSGNKTFDYTDLDTVTNYITITSHGFGAVGSYINLRYVEGESAITGMTNNAIYQFKVIDADTLEVITANPTITGTGTGHILTPQYNYSNVTTLGYNSHPTASNQIVLGNSNITEVTTYGNYVTLKSGGGLTLTSPDGMTTKTVTIDNTGTLILI